MVEVPDALLWSVYACAFIVSVTSPMLFIPWLRKLAVIDIPSERSSHQVPTLRGGGISVLAAIAIAFTVALVPPLSGEWRLVLLVLGVVILACGTLGWIEDIRGLSVKVRAGVQLLIGLFGTFAVSWVTAANDWWWIPAGAVAVAAYINVANFMDGINGVSGFHGLVVGSAYAIAGLYFHLDWLVIAAGVVALAFAGFLPWNRGKSPVFLGDVGSYLLGGAISIIAVAAFLYRVPLEFIFPPVLVYLADTFVTLVRRIAEGERWYTPHRQHAYQRMVIVGLTHAQATAVVTIATMLTSTIGIVFGVRNWPTVIAAALCAVVLLVYLRMPTIVQRIRLRRKERSAQQIISDQPPDVPA